MQRIPFFTSLIYYGIVFSFFFSPLVGYQKEFLWSKVFVLNLGLFFSCCASFWAPHHNRCRPLLSFPLLVFVLFVLFSSLAIAENPYQAISRISIGGGSVVLYLLLTLFVNNRKKIEGLFFCLFVSSILVSLYGILQYVEIIPVPKEFYGEKDAGSTFFRTNQAAQFLVAVLPYFLVKSVLALRGLFSQDTFRKIVWLGGTAVISVYFFIIQVRGSWIGLCIAGFFMGGVFLWFVRMKEGKSVSPRVSMSVRKKALFIIAGGVVFCAFLYIPAVQEVIRSFHGKDSPIVFRILTWKSSVKMIQDNFWLGAGTGNFETLFPKYQLPELEMMKLQEHIRVSSAHNDFLQFMAEYGIGGCIVIFWIVGYMIKIAQRSLRAAKDSHEIMILLGAGGGIVGTAVHAGVSYNLHFPVPLASVVLLFSFLETVMKNGFTNENEPVEMESIMARRNSIRKGANEQVTGFKEKVFSNEINERERGIILLSIWGQRLILPSMLLCTVFTFSTVVYAGRRAVAEIIFADGVHVRTNLSAKEAIKQITASIALYPYNDLTYFQRGLAYKGLEKWEKALLDFQRSLDLYPYNGKVYREIGLIYIQLKRYEDAQEAFRIAEEVTPGLKETIQRDREKISGASSQ